MITVHNPDGDSKTCTVVHHDGKFAYVYFHLSWKLASKLQERQRSEQEKRLLKPFDFMPKEAR